MPRTDWVSSGWHIVLLQALELAATGPPGGTSSVEDYTRDLIGTPRIPGGHMLEACPTIAVGRPGSEVCPLSTGGREEPARLVLDAAPGASVVDGWCDRRRRVSLEPRAPLLDMRRKVALSAVFT